MATFGLVRWSLGFVGIGEDTGVMSGVETGVEGGAEGKRGEVLTLGEDGPLNVRCEPNAEVGISILRRGLLLVRRRLRGLSSRLGT